MTSLALSWALLAAAIVPAAFAVAWICGARTTENLLLCAAIGGGVCWLSGALALTAALLGNRWQSPVQGVLLGMLFRMGLPLVALVALPKLGGMWAAPGVGSTIAGVYLIALVVETVLSLRMVPPQTPAAKAI